LVRLIIPQQHTMKIEHCKKEFRDYG